MGSRERHNLAIQDATTNNSASQSPETRRLAPAGTAASVVRREGPDKQPRQLFLSGSAFTPSDFTPLSFPLPSRS